MKCIAKAPGMGILEKIFDQNYTKKRQCVNSQSCQGWNYQVFSGHFDGCGSLHPFWAWNQHIKESNYDETYQKFCEQYDVEPFDVVNNAYIRKYFAAKYGLFTCYDSKVKWGNGQISLEPQLIEDHEKRNLKRTWIIALVSALNAKSIGWAALDEKRIPYNQSKLYKKYIKRDKKDIAYGMRLSRAVRLQEEAENRKKENDSETRKKEKKEKPIKVGPITSKERAA